jgi:sugar lactone lactonase YvrE
MCNQITAELLIKMNCTLAEGPLWHAKRNSIWWTDIEANKIFEYNLTTLALKEWDVPKNVSLIRHIKNSSKLLICIEDGIALFNIDTGHIQYLKKLEPELATNRSNDGACDAKGRLWLGTMDKTCAAKKGNLYCLLSNGNPVIKIEDVTIPNGLTWSKDNHTLYFIDSAQYNVKAYQYNIETAQLHFIKNIIEMNEKMGMPDGMAMDNEGMLWIAQWGGFCVNRWDPSNGKLLQTINIPCPYITSCAFGGNDYNTLFITTAKMGMSKHDLIKYPLSGSIFIAKTSVAGFTIYPFSHTDDSDA